MNKHNIIAMAREANRYASNQTGVSYEWQEIRDERFAALVAAAERESFQTKCKQYAAWMEEAAGDIEDWGLYASDYLQKKYDLAGQVLEYKIKADTIKDMK